jgi:hypothetical protein
MTTHWIVHGIHILTTIELLQETLQKGDFF